MLIAIVRQLDLTPLRPAQVSSQDASAGGFRATPGQAPRCPLRLVNAHAREDCISRQSHARAPGTVPLDCASGRAGRTRPAIGGGWPSSSFCWSSAVTDDVTACRLIRRAGWARDGPSASGASEALCTACDQGEVVGGGDRNEPGYRVLWQAEIASRVGLALLIRRPLRNCGVSIPTAGYGLHWRVPDDQSGAGHGAGRAVNTFA